LRRCCHVYMTAKGGWVSRVSCSNCLPFITAFPNLALALRPTQPPIQWISQGIKQLGLCLLQLCTRRMKSELFRIEILLLCCKFVDIVIKYFFSFLAPQPHGGLDQRKAFTLNTWFRISHFLRTTDHYFPFEPVWTTCFEPMWPSSGSPIYTKSLYCSGYVNISRSPNVPSDKIL
jgi:hypothetical protein